MKVCSNCGGSHFVEYKRVKIGEHVWLIRIDSSRFYARLEGESNERQILEFKHDDNPAYALAQHLFNLLVESG